MSAAGPRVLALLVAAAFATLAIGATHLVVQAVYDDHLASVTEGDRVAASATSAELAATIDTMESDLRAAADSLLTRYGAARRDRAVLSTILAELAPLVGRDAGDLSGLLYADLDGTLLAAEPADPALAETGLRGWPEVMAAINEDRPAIGQVRLSALRGNPPMLAVAVPVRDGFGQRTGALVGLLDLRHVDAWIVPPGERAYVVDALGRLVYPAAAAGETQLRDLSEEELVRAALAGAFSGRSVDPLTGQTVIAGTALVPRTGWAVVVPDPYEPIVRDRWKLEGQALGAVGIAVVPLLVGAYVLGGTIDTRRRTAAALAASEARAATSERGVIGLLAHVSHDVRTPVTSILGFTELIEQEVGPRLADRERRYLANIQRAARDLLALLADVLDLTNVEGARLRLARSPVPVADLVRPAVAAVAASAASRDIRIDVPELPSDLVVVDADRLRHVVRALVANALAYTASGGSVGVSASVATRALRIDVHDMGSGISEERRGEVFRAFERTRDPVTGTPGVGLALANRLVELHGGSITVDSSERDGTTFHVVIPDAAPPAPE